MGFDLVTVGIVCADVMVRPVESLPERGKLALVPMLEMHVGGLAGVTAAVFSRLGGSAAFIGHLGVDSFGDYIVNTLKASGVSTELVHRDPALHSSATVVLIGEDGERTFLHHMGANAGVSEADLNFDVIGSSKLFHWGGPSVSPKLDGPPMGRAFEKARSLGVKTSMDTCFDGKGVWLPLIEPSLPHLDIVMTSAAEASQYTGRSEPEAVAEFFRSYGAETVMVKLGEEGLYVTNGSEEHHLPAHSVEVLDTTGAGDAACGGFLHGYLQGWDLERCGSLANAVGGLTVQQMGGGEAVESLEAVLAFMEGEASRDAAAVAP